MFQFIRALSALLLAFACLTRFAAPAAAESEPSSGASVAQSAEQSVDHLEQLVRDYETDLAEADALDAEAAAVGGDDGLALWVASNEIRLASMDLVRDAVASVVELESNGVDATAYRELIGGFLPSLSAELRQAYDQLTTSVLSLHEKLDAMSGADRLPLAQRIRREEETVDRILAEAAEQIPRLELFGLQAEADADRAWLAERAASRARLMSGRITLIGIRVADLAVSGADSATIQAHQNELSARLSHATRSLQRTVAVLELIGLDAARYKRILISSTGEITTEILDAQVAQELVGQWVGGVTDSVVEKGPGLVFRLLLFGLVVGLFVILARFVRRVTERAVEAPNLHFSQLLKRMVVSLASGLVMMIGVLVALSQLGFEVGPMVAGLGIAGFIVGFALQETLGNFAAGVMILAYRPYDVGDTIECAGGAVFGKVSHMSLVSTTILTLDNQTRVVPNGKIWGDVITNVTQQAVRRVDLMFGIGYGDDIAHAEEVLWSIVKEHPKVVSMPEPIVKLHELGDSSVNFVVRPWTASEDYWDVYWDVTREVKVRFDREGISIPFPQRDVHMHTVEVS